MHQARFLGRIGARQSSHTEREDTGQHHRIDDSQYQFGDLLRWYEPNGTQPRYEYGDKNLPPAPRCRATLVQLFD